ncbi:MAG: hypothetical protein WA030_02100 [Candidatus Microsaccharimonas sp.]
MAITYAQLERAIGELQQQIDILSREFGAFRAYVNKQFEHIYGRFEGIEINMATKQDVERILTRIIARIDELQHAG